MNLADTLQRYLQRYPADRDGLSLLLRQAAAGEDVQGRTNFTGHVTAAAIVLSPDRQKVVLIHHVFLDKWIQPGGHWDTGEPSVVAAARREAEEETAVRIAEYLPLDADHPDVPVHIDTHHIPVNPKKGEPAHYHHDFRYVFIAADVTLVRAASEVHDARWLRLDDPAMPAELHEVLCRTRELIVAG